MKYWVSHLPLEVWVDVFCYPWISREELGRIVDRFGNRKYAEYLQFFLHDWGKHKLNWLCFDKHFFYKYVNYAKYVLYFPQTPMPVNIKSFQCISIYHFDAQTNAFLRQIGPILSNVNLELWGYLPDHLENFRIILVNLLPLLNSVRSLAFNMCALLTVKQCFGEEFNKVKVLEICGLGSEDEATVRAQADVLLDWILQAQDNNGPKCCKTILSNELFERIFPAIRQEFFAAKTPRTFALDLAVDYRAWQQFVDFHLTNNIGEEMHGVKKQDGSAVRITRHLANCGRELEECVGAMASMAQSDQDQIVIYQPTIGLINAVGAPENADGDAQQPSTSKKARIS